MFSAWWARFSASLFGTVLWAGVAAAQTSPPVTPAPGPPIVTPLPTTPVPAINNGGFVDGASFRLIPGPGALAALFGTGLSTTTAQADSLPLPLLLNGVTVTINGIVAPLILVSPFQVNLQVPWEVAGQDPWVIVVTDNFVASQPITVNAARISPAIFTVDAPRSLQGAILIDDTGELAAPSGFSINGRTGRPASRGEFVAIFCTGLGQVTNRPATGAPALIDPLSVLLRTPSVTIGGVPAAVSFAGLAPGFVGLYQVNVQVPVTAPVGDSVAVVIKVGAAASLPVAMAVQ